MNSIKTRGKFELRVIRDGEIVHRDSFYNGIVDQGRLHLLDVAFGSTAKATWYCGLISTLTVLANADTAASHTGWTEYALYDETTREAWVTGAAADNIIWNGVANFIEFTIDDATPPTLNGMFIISDSTKSGTAGVLWSTAAFTIPYAPSDNDVVQVQYQVEIL